MVTSRPAPDEPDDAPISASLIREIADELAHGAGVWRRLPGGARLAIDRPLPFLVVYRGDPVRGDAGTGAFVSAEAAYLRAPGGAVARGLPKLVRRIAEVCAARLGGFLILELWTAPDASVPRELDVETGESQIPAPHFRIRSRFGHRPDRAIATLEYALQRVKIQRVPAIVEVNLASRDHPPEMPQLIGHAAAKSLNCHVLGLEIVPTFRDTDTGELFNDVARALRRGVSRALRKTFFTFALTQTRERPENRFVLGRRALPPLILRLDRQLAAISQEFRFLLQLTPVNAERAWQAFAASGYQTTPTFQYRPLAQDPLVLKRRVLAVRTENVADPVLAHLLRSTQSELERQITMLEDLGTPRFLPGSVQVFGAVDAKLLSLARTILEKSPRPATRGEDGVSAPEFARRAKAEIRHYARNDPQFSAQAIVSKDMFRGLLTSGGNLTIGYGTQVLKRQVEAMLQHEVGTHLVTYYNGKAQALKLLQVGLAGYDGLQEGIAVLAEHLVGELSWGRLRVIAARVVAVDMMTRGASFPEVFDALHTRHGFEPRIAYTIVVRVFRGGGLTKDAIYLRGLRDVLDYLSRGGDLEVLMVGKLALEHVPVVKELLAREVLRPPVHRPRFLDHPLAGQRLERLRAGREVFQLPDG